MIGEMPASETEAARWIDWHYGSEDQGDGGCYCAECGGLWPCPSYDAGVAFFVRDGSQPWEPR